MSRKLDPKPLDPLLEKTIQRAMAPYLRVLPPEGLRIMRDALIDALTTHPVALEALEALRERPPADGSGPRARDGEDDKAGGGQEGTA